VETIPAGTPNAFTFLIGECCKIKQTCDVLAFTSSLTQGFGSVKEAHAANIRSMWISSSPTTSTPCPEDLTGRIEDLAAFSEGTIVPDFQTVSFCSLPSTMDYSITTDSEFIHKQSPSVQNAYRSELIDNQKLPTQNRLSYCLLFDELSPKFLGKTSIKGLLL